MDIDPKCEWLKLTRELAPGPEPALRELDDLRHAYSEPTRHYHGFSHIEGMLELAGPDAEPELLWAIWYHDRIYDTHASDNEERSAERARSILGQWGADEALCKKVAGLILLTKKHDPQDGDEIGQRLVDYDLAILGSSPQEYAQYAEAIRREYAWVPEETYRAERAQILRSFLQRDRIYHTEAMRAERESQARRNIEKELESLS